MAGHLSAELSATCNALGYFDEKTNKYYADGNTLETVKDLIRYLRRDDAQHAIRRHLGATKILQTDLLPLLKSYWQEVALFDVLLRLIVNLTSPALMLWNQEVPTDKTSRNFFLQVEEHLLGYKQAFTDEAIWAVLSTRLSQMLEIDHAERGDENSLIIERILILIRNVLYVAPDVFENRTDNDASLHDQVLWALHQSGLLDVLLYICSASNEQAYYMHVVEILSFMLKEQNAEELAKAALQRSQTEKIRDEAELLAIRHRETNKRQERVKMYSGTRHSRFGGTFVVKSMKSISDNELIYHKPLSKLDALNFDADKKRVRTPKNRLPMVGQSTERRSAFTIRLFLKEFCVEFLNGAYNTFMYHIKDSLARAKAQQHDESYYLWALRFFMEFNRCYNFQVKLVSETMSVQTFHFVQQQSEDYFDLMASDKKHIKLWSRRLHLALLAYRELFQTLSAMDKSKEQAVKDSAKVIKNNVFYIMEYREFILNLLISYDELKMSDVYLKDLIETQHIFLRMLEGFCGRGDNTIVVQKKARSKKPKKKVPEAATPAAVEQTTPSSSDLNLESRWDEASPQLSVVLNEGVELPPVVPFDATSDVPVDNQKASAMRRIQDSLREGQFEEAVALLRASREVWPENDCFGSANMATEEEFLALREVFFADLGGNAVGVPPKKSAMPAEEPLEDEYDDEGDDEEDEYENQYVETDFKLNDFLQRLAHPKIIRACGLALRNFESNSVSTNHCIVKLLHRIAFDCKMYVMLFQVSIFQTFQKIFVAKALEQYKELVKFAVYIIRQFFKVAEINKKVFMEALFWKSSKDALEIEQGYGSLQGRSQALERAWSEEQEDELRTLFMEHKEKEISEDLVDWLSNNLIDNTKTRRAIIKKLKEMYLLTDYKKSGSSSKQKPSKFWTEEEESHLAELFEQFREHSDPLSCIMEQMENKRPKNRIIEKLLIMGLVQDRKELYKKRSKKSQAGDNDGSQSEDEPSSSSRKPARKRQQTKRKTSRVASQAQVIQNLLEIANLEMNDALEWLKESLSDAIEDLQDGSNEGIPLVPIMDFAVDAMEVEQFQRMLKAMGINEPFDEQEAYWRIPGDIPAERLSEYSDLIQKALDKTLELPSVEEPQETQDEGGNYNSESDEDVFDKLKKFVVQEEVTNSTNSNKKSKGVENLESSSSEEETLENSSTSQIVLGQNSNEEEAQTISIKNQEEEETVSLSKKRKTQRIVDDEESSADEAENQDEEERAGSPTTEKRTKRIEDSSEDELGNQSNNEKKLVNTSKKASRFLEDSDESEKENQPEKRARGSDSEADIRTVKRSRMIDSDSD